MFLHCLKYELKTSLRARDLIIWLILFPIVLGTLFKIAFGSIYEKNTLFRSIPAAVVETADNNGFRTAAEAVSTGDSPLLALTYTDEQTALDLLKNKEISGILYAGDTVTLTVGGSGIQESILKSFVEQYGIYETVLRQTAEQDPARLPAVAEALSADVSACTRLPLTDGNTDQFTQFFYNLIAMVAIFGSITGLHIAIDYQANLSPLGARRSCASVPYAFSRIAAILGSWLTQAVCMVICVSYLAFVLKIDFGSRLPLVYLAAVLAGCMGVSLGFFIGSIGKLSQNAKISISMTVSMTGCFLSGLMVGNMKAVLAEKAPWVNAVNPVAVISDSFYCLNLYSDYRRFSVKIITMLILTAVFTLLGTVLSGRKKYASI